jgi:hypothetical protein
VALIEALNKAKPATSKGVYLRKVAVSSTMGLGVRVDIQTLNAQGWRRELAGPARGRPVWWAAGPANESGGPSKTVGAAAMLLIAAAKANADGDPADRRIREISEDSWSLQGRAQGATPKRTFEGVDLESESQ